MPVGVWAGCHWALGTAGPQVTSMHGIISSSAQSRRDGPLGRQLGENGTVPLTEGDRNREVLFIITGRESGLGILALPQA